MPGSAQVDLACSPGAALSLLDRTAYDLLLVNTQAESLDSIEVLRELRRADNKTEAVIVTGWLTPRLVEIGRHLGVSRFFRLPADMDAFSRHLMFSSS